MLLQVMLPCDILFLEHAHLILGNYWVCRTENSRGVLMAKLLAGTVDVLKPGPKVIKLFSCSTQLSMKFFLLINVKMPTIVGILTFMSRKNTILDLSEPEKR